MSQELLDHFRWGVEIDNLSLLFHDRQYYETFKEKLGKNYKINDMKFAYVGSGQRAIFVLDREDEWWVKYYHIIHVNKDYDFWLLDTFASIDYWLNSYLGQDNVVGKYTRIAQTVQRTFAQLERWYNFLVEIGYSLSTKPVQLVWLKSSSQQFLLPYQLLVGYYSWWRRNYRFRRLMINLMRLLPLDNNYIRFPLYSLWDSLRHGQLGVEWIDFVKDVVLLMEDSFPGLEWSWDGWDTAGQWWSDISFMRSWRLCKQHSSTFQSQSQYLVVRYARSPLLGSHWRNNLSSCIFWNALLNQPWIQFKEIAWGSQEFQPDIIFISSPLEVCRSYNLQPRFVLDFDERWNEQMLVPNTYLIRFHDGLAPIMRGCVYYMPLLLNYNFWGRYFRDYGRHSMTLLNRHHFGTLMLGDWERRKFFKPNENETYYWVSRQPMTYLVSVEQPQRDGRHVLISSWNDLEWVLPRVGTILLADHISQLTIHDRIIMALGRLLNHSFTTMPVLSLERVSWLLVMFLSMHAFGFQLPMIRDSNWLWNSSGQPLIPSSSLWLGYNDIVWADIVQDKLGEQWVGREKWEEQRLIFFGSGERRQTVLLYLWYVGVGIYSGVYPALIKSLALHSSEMAASRNVIFVLGSPGGHQDEIVKYWKNQLLSNCENLRVNVLMTNQVQDSVSGRVIRLDGIYDDSKSVVFVDNMNALFEKPADYPVVYVSNRDLYTVYYESRLRGLCSLVYGGYETEIVKRNYYGGTVSNPLRLGVIGFPLKLLVRWQLMFPWVEFYGYYDGMSLVDFISNMDILVIDGNERAVMMCLENNRAIMGLRRGLMADIENYGLRLGLEFPGWILNGEDDDNWTNSMRDFMKVKLEVRQKERLCYYYYWSMWSKSHLWLLFLQDSRFNLFPRMEISVIVPYYEVRSSHMESFLDSIQNQFGLGVYFSLDLVLLNDGNPEQFYHRDLITEYHERWSKGTNDLVSIRVIDYGYRYGKNWLLKDGVYLANHDCIMPMDATTVLPPMRIWSQAQQMYGDKRDGKRIIRGGQTVGIDDDNHVIVGSESKYPYHVSNHMEFNSFTVSYWREDILDVGNYPITEILEGDESELWKNVLSQNIEIRNEKEIYGWVR